MSDITTTEFMERVVRFLDRYEQTLPPPTPPLDWSNTFAARWVGEGSGGCVGPLGSPAGRRLDDLVGVGRQQQLLEANPSQFVRGLPANNALLWGARGTGKASLVRALLHAWKDQGLRL